jgi:hypothetical protein
VVGAHISDPRKKKKKFLFKFFLFWAVVVVLLLGSRRRLCRHLSHVLCFVLFLFSHVPLVCPFWRTMKNKEEEEEKEEEKQQHNFHWLG